MRLLKFSFIWSNFVYLVFVWVFFSQFFFLILYSVCILRAPTMLVSVFLFKFSMDDVYCIQFYVYFAWMFDIIMGRKPKFVAAGQHSFYLSVVWFHSHLVTQFYAHFSTLFYFLRQNSQIQPIKREWKEQQRERDQTDSLFFIFINHVYLIIII